MTTAAFQEFLQHETMLSLDAPQHCSNSESMQATMRNQQCTGVLLPPLCSLGDPGCMGPMASHIFFIKSVKPAPADADQHLRGLTAGSIKGFSEKARTTGTHKMLFVAAQFNDVVAFTSPSTALSGVQAVARQMETIITSQSYGQMELKITVPNTVYTINLARSSQPTADQMQTAALDAIKTASAPHQYADPLSAYSYVGVYYGQIPHVGWSGLANMAGQFSWYNVEEAKISSELILVLYHELGHNFGLSHANFAATEYGNPFDSMGISTKITMSFQIGYKFPMHWVPQTSVVPVHPYGPWNGCSTCARDPLFIMAPHDLGLEGIPKSLQDDITAKRGDSGFFNARASTSSKLLAAYGFRMAIPFDAVVNERVPAVWGDTNGQDPDVVHGVTMNVLSYDSTVSASASLVDAKYRAASTKGLTDSDITPGMSFFFTRDRFTDKYPTFKEYGAVIHVLPNDTTATGAALSSAAAQGELKGGSTTKSSIVQVETVFASTGDPVNGYGCNDRGCFQPKTKFPRRTGAATQYAATRAAGRTPTGVMPLNELALDASASSTASTTLQAWFAPAGSNPTNKAALRFASPVFSVSTKKSGAEVIAVCTGTGISSAQAEALTGLSSPSPTEPPKAAISLAAYAGPEPPADVAQHGATLDVGYVTNLVQQSELAVQRLQSTPAQSQIIAQARKMCPSGSSLLTAAALFVSADKPSIVAIESAYDRANAADHKWNKIADDHLRPPYVTSSSSPTARAGETAVTVTVHMAELETTTNMPCPGGISLDSTKTNYGNIDGDYAVDTTTTVYNGQLVYRHSQGTLLHYRGSAWYLADQLTGGYFDRGPEGVSDLVASFATPDGRWEDGPYTVKCNSCPSNYRPVNGYCTRCPDHQVADTAGNCQCEPGYASGSGNTCVQCPAGKVKATAGDAECQACPRARPFTAPGAVSAAACSANPNSLRTDRSLREIVSDAQQDAQPVSMTGVRGVVSTTLPAQNQARRAAGSCDITTVAFHGSDPSSSSTVCDMSACSVLYMAVSDPSDSSRNSDLTMLYGGVYELVKVKNAADLATLPAANRGTTPTDDARGNEPFFSSTQQYWIQHPASSSRTVDNTFVLFMTAGSGANAGKFRLDLYVKAGMTLVGYSTAYYPNAPGTPVSIVTQIKVSDGTLKDVNLVWSCVAASPAFYATSALTYPRTISSAASNVAFSLRACPANSISKWYATAQSDCLCKAGYTKSGSDCVPCPSGTFKQAAGDEACVSCAGRTVLTGRTGCDCGSSALEFDATKGTCVDLNECGSGRYGDAACSALSLQCVDMIGGWTCRCPAGQEYDITAGKCVKCGPGSYRDSSALTCQRCPAGSTSATGSTSISACTCMPNLLTPAWTKAAASSTGVNPTCIAPSTVDITVSGVSQHSMATGKFQWDPRPHFDRTGQRMVTDQLQFRKDLPDNTGNASIFLRSTTELKGRWVISPDGYDPHPDTDPYVMTRRYAFAEPAQPTIDFTEPHAVSASTQYDQLEWFWWHDTLEAVSTAPIKVITTNGAWVQASTTATMSWYPASCGYAVAVYPSCASGSATTTAVSTAMECKSFLASSAMSCSTCASLRSACTGVSGQQVTSPCYPLGGVQCAATSSVTAPHTCAAGSACGKGQSCGRCLPAAHCTVDDDCMDGYTCGSTGSPSTPAKRRLDAAGNSTTPAVTASPSASPSPSPSAVAVAVKYCTPKHASAYAAYPNGGIIVVPSSQAENDTVQMQYQLQIDFTGWSGSLPSNAWYGSHLHSLVEGAASSLARQIADQFATPPLTSAVQRVVINMTGGGEPQVTATIVHAVVASRALASTALMHAAPGIRSWLRGSLAATTSAQASNANGLFALMAQAGVQSTGTPSHAASVLSSVMSVGYIGNTLKVTVAGRLVNGTDLIDNTPPGTGGGTGTGGSASPSPGSSPSPSRAPQPSASASPRPLVCHSSCATCSSTGRFGCTACDASGSTPFLQASNGESYGACLNSCEYGQYASASTGQCRTCGSSCRLCDATGRSQCYEFVRSIFRLTGVTRSALSTAGGLTSIRNVVALMMRVPRDRVVVSILASSSRRMLTDARQLNPGAFVNVQVDVKTAPLTGTETQQMERERAGLEQAFGTGSVSTWLSATPANPLRNLGSASSALSSAVTNSAFATAVAQNLSPGSSITAGSLSTTEISTVQQAPDEDSDGDDFDIMAAFGGGALGIVLVVVWIIIVLVKRCKRQRVVSAVQGAISTVQGKNAERNADRNAVHHHHTGSQQPPQQYGQPPPGHGPPGQQLGYAPTPQQQQYGQQQYGQPQQGQLQHADFSHHPPVGGGYGGSTGQYQQQQQAPGVYYAPGYTAQGFPGVTGQQPQAL